MKVLWKAGVGDSRSSATTPGVPEGAAALAVQLGLPASAKPRTVAGKAGTITPQPGHRDCSVTLVLVSLFRGGLHARLTS